MAPKRPSPLDNPPAASSEEEEEEASSEEGGEEEEESGSGSESESEEPEPPKTSTLPPTPAAEKKPPPKKPDSAVVNSKAQSSSSGSESESESGSDLDVTAKRRANVAAAAANVKPIASKPMEETPQPPKTKPRSKSSATAAATSAAARAGSKRPSESEPKESSKRPKKKGPDQEADEAEEEPKKAGAGGDDSKKLFQRIWSDEDEITILKGMIDYTAKKGVDPYADMAAFHDFIKKSLKADVNKTQLQDKVRRLKKKYEANVTKGKKYNPIKPHEVKVFELSKKVWGAGGGEGSSGGGFELSKCNGKTKNNQKGNSKTVTLASLKAELLGSPEPLKEAEKAKICYMPVASESSSEVIGFDKGFRELGLPETVVKQGLELIGGSKRAELKDKWNDLHVAELELFVKRTELMRDQAKMILEAFKSSNH